MLKTMLLLFGLLHFASHANEQAAPRPVQAPEVLEAMRLVRSYTDLGLSPEFRVQGDQYLDKQQVFAVSRLVLAPGSRVLFTGSAYGDRADRYIVAQTIQVLPGTPPPVITWVRQSADVAQYNPMLQPGKAPAGASGVAEGAEGGPGPNGQTGNPGVPGRSAPTIYVFAGRIEGGAIFIDLHG